MDVKQVDTGYSPYHKLIKRRNPEIIAKYGTFDRSNLFDPIKLRCIITYPNEFDTSKHSILSAIIKYYTPHIYIYIYTPMGH